MRRKVKIFSLLVLLFSLVFQPGLVTAGVPEAVTYLQSQTQDAWVTMALAAANQQEIATSHLTSVSGTLATDYAKAILALASVNENPATFGNIDYVAKLRTYYEQGQMGDSNLINDDIWSILAFSSTGEDFGQEISDAKNFILANQNSDGGFSYVVGGQSDTNDTAAAIIALIEAGVSSFDSAITNALAYLQSCQNVDGGVGYQAGNDSDSGSDSWVISALNKAGVNPASWDQSGNNPITHLQSLQASDGGFWWVPEGTSEWNNKAMTAYAVIALSGKSYPLGYYQQENEEPQPGTYHLRIEGSSSTICDAYVFGNTALDIVENGAQICGYTYIITQESYGPYLREINGEQAQGMNGWLYLANHISLPIGAADYVLQSGDEILWYFGEWGLESTRISVSQLEIDPGQSVDVFAEYFDGAVWQPLPNANIKVNSSDYPADNNGRASLTINENGVYNIYVETSGYVRSQKQTVTVGDTVSQNIGMVVEINQSDTGQIGGEAIALVINPAQLNFGTLKPGQSANQQATLTNEGTVNLVVGASVSGDNIFTHGITIDGSSPNSYNQSLISEQSKDSVVTLSVPLDYLLSGVKSGELIFWATASE